MNRYSRQEMVIGQEGQEKLARARILVVGAGGLGCAALPYLVAAGVGQITLLDPDRVEESNLHRQTLYRMEDIGTLKVQAARGHLQALNPALQIIGLPDRLSPLNADEFISQSDLVIDAADSFAVSYILSDHCLRMGKPLISASVLGQTGYIGGFCAGAPSLRAVFPDLPETAASCSTAGVLGPVVGVMGALQAQMALGMLCIPDCPAMGQMITMNLQTFTTGGFSFLTAPEPECFPSFISAEQVGPSDQVVDLRSAKEAPLAIHPRANRYSPDLIAKQVFSPNQRIVLGCKTGLRAWRAAETLQQAGHENIVLMAAVVQ